LVLLFIVELILSSSCLLTLPISGLVGLIRQHTKKHTRIHKHADIGTFLEHDKSLSENDEI